MSTWISSHGAGVINTAGNSFTIMASEAGGVIRPTDANKLKGSVLFPLPSPPQNASQLNKVAVDFSSQTARVDELVILSGGDELFQKKRLRKTEDFTIKLSDVSIKAEQDGKGLALSVAVEFESVTGQLEFQSVGLEVAMASRLVERVKFDSGTWNTMDVRPWDQPQGRTEGPIKYSTEFSSTPMVTVSMTGADISGGTNFRVKVYATNVDSRGFTVHADSWGDTKIYSCGVSWMAIGY